MKRIALLLTLSYGCLLSGGAVFGQQPTQPYLEGLWQGVMTVVPQREDGSPLVPPFEGQPQFQFRLDIGRTNLVLFFPTAEGGWSPIGQGADLQLNQQGRSAIVLAAMAVGEPTETWLVNVARSDEQNITVYLSQLVSGVEGQPPARQGFIGQMQRIPRDG